LPEQWDEVVYFLVGFLDTEAARKKRETDIAELGPTKKFAVYSFKTEREMLQAWLVFRSDRNLDLEVGKQRRAAAPQQRYAAVLHFFLIFYFLCDGTA
jgi:hypothetical protein